MNQVELELLYSDRVTREMIKDCLEESEVTQAMHSKGIELLQAWIAEPSKYSAKALRREHLATLDLDKIVTAVFINVIINGLTTYTNTVMSLVGHLNLEKRTGVMLAAEVVAVLCDTDLYDLTKDGDTIMVKNRSGIPKEIKEQAERSTYLPPLIDHPMKLTHNNSTPYLSFEHESLILGGKHNHHDGDICLDVLNIQNNIPIILNTTFISALHETVPNFKGKHGRVLTNKERAEAYKAWEKAQIQTKEFHILLGSIPMYFGNKVDKRGRIYSSGYHLSPQGTSYKKASLDLYEKETIDVPLEYQL